MYSTESVIIEVCACIYGPVYISIYINIHIYIYKYIYIYIYIYISHRGCCLHHHMVLYVQSTER